MLGEILRKAYEQEKDICIFVRKDACESEKVAAIALYDALNYTNRSISVKCMFDNGLEDDANSTANIAPNDMIPVMVNIHSKDEIESDTYVGASSDNIFMIDIEIKDLKGDKARLIRDTGVPKRNIFEDKRSLSICQTMAILLKREDLLNKDVATTLIYGILKDTNNLKDANSDTLEIVSMLMENDGNYAKAYKDANKKVSLENRKVASKIFSNIDFLDLPNKKRIAFLSIDKKKAKQLKASGIDDFEKYIRKVQEIDGIDLAFAVVEHEGKKGCKIYFMKTVNNSLGDIELEDISSKFGLVKGSNTWAECEYVLGRGKTIASLINRILEEAKDQSKNATQRVDFFHDDSDKKLKEILTTTNYFSRNVTTEDLRRAAESIRKGANYSVVYNKKIPLNLFLLREEELVRKSVITDEESASIFLSNSELNMLKARYGVSDDDILSCISLFDDVDVLGAEISIDTNEGVKKSSKVFEEDLAAKRLLNSAIIAGNNMKIKADDIKKAKQSIFSRLRRKSKETEITQ